MIIEARYVAATASRPTMTSRETGTHSRDALFDLHRQYPDGVTGRRVPAPVRHLAVDRAGCGIRIEVDVPLA